MKHEIHAFYIDMEKHQDWWYVYKHDGRAFRVNMVEYDDKDKMDIAGIKFIKEWVALHDFMKQNGAFWKDQGKDLLEIEKRFQESDAFKEFLAKDEREYVLIPGEYHPNNLPFHDYA